MGGKQTVKKPLSVFLTEAIIYLLLLVLGLSTGCYHHSGFLHALLTQSHYVLFLCMSVIVHNGTDHVEQKRRALHGNKISCRRRSMVGAKAAPLHPFQIVINRKITVLRAIQKEHTTPISPMRSLL